MVAGSGFIPRYMNWMLETPFTRAKAQDMFAQVHKSDVKQAIKKKASEKLMREGGFHAWKYIDIIDQESEISRLDNEVLCLLLVQMAPIYWKFGFKVCSYIMNQVSSIKLEAAFCEEASQVEMKRGIHRSRRKDGEIELNAHIPKSLNTPVASQQRLKLSDIAGTLEHGRNAPKRSKPAGMNVQLTEIEAPNFDSDDDIPLKTLLERKLKRERQDDVKGKHKMVRAKKVNKECHLEIPINTEDDDFQFIMVRKVQQSGEGEVSVKAQYKRRQTRNRQKPHDQIYKEKESYNAFIEKYTSVLPAELYFDSETKNWMYDFSIFFDPFADQPPALICFDDSKNYPGRGMVSSTVCKLIDSWLDKVSDGTIDSAHKAYDDCDRLWCSVEQMKEFVLGESISVEVCYFLLLQYNI
jgi:hypothetical protein